VYAVADSKSVAQQAFTRGSEQQHAEIIAMLGTMEAALSDLHDQLLAILSMLDESAGEDLHALLLELAPLPVQLNLVATAVAEGRQPLDPSLAWRLIDGPYPALNDALTFIPVPARLAVQAGCMALREVLGQDPFATMRQWRRNEPDGSVRLAMDWTDEERGEQGLGDSAGLAAVAFACSPAAFACDPRRLQTFWEWWLLEVLPGSWHAARQ
jgi:hypothetical protein